LIDAGVRRLLDLTELMGQRHRIAEKDSPSLLTFLISFARRQNNIFVRRATKHFDAQILEPLLRFYE